MRVVEEYEADLVSRFRAALREIPGVEPYAAPDGVRKTPTVAFRVNRYTPREVTARMAQEGFFVADGHFYASALAEKRGIADRGGWIRARLAPYNTREEVEDFVETLAAFAGQRRR